MSSLWQPVGPQPPRVYWIRRGLVIVAVLLLLWLGSLAIRALVPDQQKAVPATVASLSQEATPGGVSREASSTSSQEGAAKQNRESDKSADQNGSDDSDGAVACSQSSVDLGLVGATKRPVGGAPLAFEVSVTNKTTVPCVVDLSPDTLELKVVSGSDRIWTSNHCDAWVPAMSKKLNPKETLKTKLTWPGRRSADGCKVKSDVLRSGTYVATAHFGITRSPKFVMQLRKG